LKDKNILEVHRSII